MNTRGSFRNNYGWSDAQRDLADGIHPAVVSARLGEPIDYLLQTAGAQGWPIRWQPHPLPSADEMLDRCNRLYGLDA